MISPQRSLAVVAVILAGLTAGIAHADVSVSGDVNPGDPNTWDSNTVLNIGDTGTGAVEITNGEAVTYWQGYIALEWDSTGAVTIDGAGSSWTNSRNLSVGNYGYGTLEITNGGVATGGRSTIGSGSESTGVVRVDGNGSTWTSNGQLTVGGHGIATLEITNGGAVSNDEYCWVAYYASGEGSITVDGVGSVLTNNGDLYIGKNNKGTMNITNGGLVSVAGLLNIDDNGDGNSFIRMATGGMLLLAGDADDSLAAFLGLASGTDEIRYWDDSISGWADITGATVGEDYTLGYLAEGDLAGYTMLTVTAVPEPAALSLLAIGGVAILRRRRR